eukprot:scaffold77481_cov64-Phaeocystis_antarctica.AAC.6
MPLQRRRQRWRWQWWPRGRGDAPRGRSGAPRGRGGTPPGLRVRCLLVSREATLRQALRR